MFSRGMIIVGILSAAAAGSYMLPAVQSDARRPLASLVKSSCGIKGNISINTGERIYHVSGQKYYDQTVIRPEYGERWFCSEAEARAAGWRKSRE